MLSRILTVPSLDPEDARRRRLLNILLAGVWLLSVVTLLGALAALATGILSGTDPGTALLFMGLGAMILGLGVIFVINRYVNGPLASVLFLLLLTGIFIFSDTPAEVVEGRTLFTFALPIMMASVLLRPWGSFAAAGIISAALTAIAVNIGLAPNVVTVTGLLAIALVAFLSSRSLETALADLRAINANLDERVKERTQELALALEQIRREYTQNQAILESIADGVIVFNEHQQAFIANRSVQGMLNQDAGGILGREMRELMSNAVSVEEQEQLASLVESGESTPQSLKLDWGERTFSVSYAPVQAETAEEQLGSVVVFRDFTSEAQLNRMKSALLSMASHELRTPLNAILGYADMLKEGVMGTVNAEQTLTLRRMMANVNRMLGLVNNLLDQARAEAGRLEAELAPFEVSTLFEDLTSSMQVLAENKHITLTLEVSEGLPEVLVSDAGRIRQIATNLIGNAIKFTDEGEVRVRVSRAGAGQWSFAVRDTGEGIPAEAQQYIFDTFRQVGDPTTRRHGGSGLGLSIVQQLVDLLDGKIEVESTVGAGSTFCVTLPLKETS